MPQYEWRMREIGKHGTYIDQGIIEAPDMIHAKRLVTKASNTAQWGKRWRRDGDTYFKTDGDGRSVGPLVKNISKHILYVRERK